MAPANEKLLGRVAVAAKLITPEQLSEALREHGRDLDDGRNLGQVLLDLGFVSEAGLGKIVALQQRVVQRNREQRQQAAQQSAPAPASTPANAPPGTREPARPPQTATPREAQPTGPPARVATAARPARAQAQAGAESTPDRPARAPAEEPAEIELGEPLDDAAAGGLAREATGQTGPPPAIDPELLALVRTAVAQGASDVHVHSGERPRFRIRGALVEQEGTEIPAEHAERMALSLLDAEERALFERLGELDLSCSIPELGRLRTNLYRQLRGVDVVMRHIPTEPPTLESLGLPMSLAKLTAFHQGMVLITGPTRCGKSSTMAALVNLVNEERAEHILTVEDPIEYLHPSKRCVVNLRNVRRHTESFARALRGALRQDPDVIVIGELRDQETISLAMTAAETGHFVLATLHTDNAVRTINRMVGAFPPDQQEQVRAMLSESLKAVISQRLVPASDGSGMLPALEIMLVNRAVGNLIRDKKTVQIRSTLQTGGASGMRLLDTSLAELVESGRVSREEALRQCEDPKLIPG